MRVAFHAPMKPPTHPSPSGDRRMARLLIKALEAGGHPVELASRFRTYDGAGDRHRQARIRHVGDRLAARLVRRYRARPPADRPGAWLTYHLYHKAPDWLGPVVARALEIPYLVAEASHAPKQEGGAWSDGYRAAAAAIAGADAVLGFNPVDAVCVRTLLGADRPMETLRPFLETAPLRAAGRRRDHHRRRLAAAHGIDPGVPWLLCVAMMRPGAKLASYQVLGSALRSLLERPWRLLVIGDGPAREIAMAALTNLAGRVHFLGRQDDHALRGFYAAADLFVWPAVDEAYGMALLEAQATGLAAVAGRVGGVPTIVRDGETGVLVPEGDAEAFADAVGGLLASPETRRRLGAGAARIAAAEHDIGPAAERLDAILRRLAR